MHSEFRQLSIKLSSTATVQEVNTNNSLSICNIYIFLYFNCSPNPFAAAQMWIDTFMHL